LQVERCRRAVYTTPVYPPCTPRVPPVHHRVPPCAQASALVSLRERSAERDPSARAIDGCTPVGSLLWDHSCGITPVGSLLWDHSCGITPVGVILWGLILMLRLSCGAHLLKSTGAACRSETSAHAVCGFTTFFFMWVLVCRDAHCVRTSQQCAVWCSRHGASHRTVSAGEYGVHARVDSGYIQL